jgi:hypothetical protein
MVGALGVQTHTFAMAVCAEGWGVGLQQDDDETVMKVKVKRQPRIKRQDSKAAPRSGARNKALVYEAYPYLQAHAQG